MFCFCVTTDNLHRFLRHPLDNCWCRAVQIFFIFSNWLCQKTTFLSPKFKWYQIISPTNKVSFLQRWSKLLMRGGAWIHGAKGFSNDRESETSRHPAWCSIICFLPLLLGWLLVLYPWRCSWFIGLDVVCGLCRVVKRWLSHPGRISFGDCS